MKCKTVELTPLSVEHAPDFIKWISNRKAVKYSLSVFHEDRDVQWTINYIDSITKNPTSWNMVIRYGDLAVGYTGLVNISSSNRSAEYFILIGNVSCWNMGIGTKAGAKVLEHAFGALDLHRVFLTVSDCNSGAIRSYEKLGFKVDGRMRDACLRDGRYHDKIIMSILSHEWPKSGSRE